MHQSIPHSRRETTTVAIDPPTFSPPPEMRAAYLQRHASEVEMLLVSARAGDWKPVVIAAGHVRGTGAMYGFPEMGEAAERLGRAIQNGDPHSFHHLETYVEVVKNSSV